MSVTASAPIRRRAIIAIALISLAIAAIAAVWWSRRPPRYVPTPQNEALTARLVNGALTFVLLHESGHMMIKLFDLPKIGGEEDEADHFAAAVLTAGIGAQPPSARDAVDVKGALISAAMFFDQLHQNDVRASRTPAWSDEHGDPEQRAYNIICMLYGRSPQEFGEYARRAGLPPQRLASCPAEAQQNEDSWRMLMSEARRKMLAGPAYHPISTGQAFVQAMMRNYVVPEEHKVGTFLLPVPDDVDPATRARLLRGRAIAQQGDALAMTAAMMRQAPMPVKFKDPAHPEDDYGYKLIGSPCLDKGVAIENAWWKASDASITVCYGLIASIQEAAQREVAAGGS